MATTREERTVMLEVISATDLKKVKTFGKQDAYAVVYVDARDRKSSKVDTLGGLNPVWNAKFHLKVDEQHIQQERGAIFLEVHCKSTFGSKLLGKVGMPLANLPKENAAPEYMAFELRRKSGKAQGIVNVSIALGEKKTVPIYQPPPMRSGVGTSNRPVAGYPAQQGNYQRQQQYGYPQQQYGYPQQQYGYAQQPYGYPQQGYAQQQRRRPGMGGAGLGLGAGLLGGLLVGEALDNNNYNDNNYGDGGGGDYGGGDFGGGDFGGGDF